MKRVKVTRIPGAFALDGVSYGPFQANQAQPYAEVPETLANALKLPLHESEPPRKAPAPAQGGDLKAEYAALQAEAGSLKARIAELEAELQSVRGERGGDGASESDSLPDDFPMRARLLEHGFDTLEKVRAGLERPEGAEKSPIENLQGIGARTADTIRAALQ